MTYSLPLTGKPLPGCPSPNLLLCVLGTAPLCTTRKAWLCHSLHDSHQVIHCPLTLHVGDCKVIHLGFGWDNGTTFLTLGTEIVLIFPGISLDLAKNNSPTFSEFFITLQAKGHFRYSYSHHLLNWQLVENFKQWGKRNGNLIDESRAKSSRDVFYRQYT